MTQSEKTRIYKSVAMLLEKSSMDRTKLIESICTSMGYCTSMLAAGSKECSTRGAVGSIINEMIDSGLLKKEENDKLTLITTRPILIRIERCEREIIKALTESPKTKRELKALLDSVFGANITSSQRDNDTISAHLDQVLKKLILRGAIIAENGVYSVCPKIAANPNRTNEIIALKADFLSKLHTKGGEFFEGYFMTLLSKFYTKQKKKILECYVTGGSADGGIDGVMVTEDALGFKETTMVQTKNRIEIATETDVRGFYGAVCAKKGTRGIYAISSDFHQGAKDFLSSLDDCVGVNGDIIFKMAAECLHGLKKIGNNLTVDSNLL